VEDDKGMTPLDTTINYKVSSFQINLSCGFENKLLPNDLIIVRNHGNDEDVGQELGGMVDQQMASKSSWRPNPCQVQVCLGVQDQSTLKQMLKSNIDSVLDILHMHGKLIR
jgi:hypothetical protein